MKNGFKKFCHQFYIKNYEFLIGPDEHNESNSPKYKESKYMNGEVKNNIPLFSFRFGFIVTEIDFYIKSKDGNIYNDQNGIRQFIGNPYDMEIINKKSFFKNQSFIIQKSNNQKIEIFKLDTFENSNDLEVFKRFLFEYKNWYNTNDQIKLELPNYDQTFQNQLKSLIDDSGNVGGFLNVVIDNEKIYLVGVDLYRRSEIKEEIKQSDKVISKYLDGLLGYFIQGELKKNQMNGEKILFKYLNHYEIKSKGIESLDSFSKLKDVKEKISFLKEFVIGKTGGFLNESSITNFSQYERLIDLIRNYNGNNLKSEKSKIETLNIVDIYSTLLNGLPKDIINQNDDITKNLIRVENKLNERENSINSILIELKSVQDLSQFETLINHLEIQKSQFQHMVYISCELLKSHEEHDKLTFYRIYDVLDEMDYFNSSWEKSLISEIKFVNEKLDQIVKKLNDIERSIVVTIQGLNDELGNKFDQFNSNITSKLGDIDDSIMLGNWINLVNTIQIQKVNKNTKSLRG